MKKQDIINEVCARTGIEKTPAKAIIDEAIDVIAKGICDGETIYLRGLFTLLPVKRKEKKAQNITAGKTIVLPERYVPKAKFSRSIIKEMQKLPVEKK